MQKINNETPLERLLSCCCDRTSPQYQMAWGELLRRYHQDIHKYVARSAYRWRAPRLKRQLQATVDDIVAEVYRILCADDHRALRYFRHKESEGRFRSWLALVAHRAASRSLKNLFWGEVNEDESLLDLAGDLDEGEAWELFEDVAHHVREATSNRKQLIERNLTMFFLRYWGGYSPAMTVGMPCLSGMRPHNVETNVSRVLQLLKKEWQAHAEI